MSQLLPPERLFDVAISYWARLREFVENHKDVSDYLLRRVQCEYAVLRQEYPNLDFNVLYRDRFTEFVLASYVLFMERLRHRPPAYASFVIPSDDELARDVRQHARLDARLVMKWKFENEVQDEFIKTMTDIHINPCLNKFWNVHTYVIEHTVQRFVGRVDDGKKFHLAKTVMENHYRMYPDVYLSIRVEKNFPNGPYKYRVFQVGTTTPTDRQKELVFSNVKSLDDFVEQQKVEFDGMFLLEKKEGDSDKK